MLLLLLLLGGGEYVWETDGGSWVFGGCEGKRRSLPDLYHWGLLDLPHDGYDVIIVTAYANRYGAVEISDPVKLIGESWEEEEEEQEE